MSKVTSKLQVTIPKAIAERHGVRPGDEVRWISAGDAIRIEPSGRSNTVSVAERLRLFDAATRRLRRKKWEGSRPTNRGWSRAELYEDRGRPR
jgi:AbrB family looped-hinge helix DNA binding protein